MMGHLAQNGTFPDMFCKEKFYTTEKRIILHLYVSNNCLPTALSSLTSASKLWHSDAYCHGAWVLMFFSEWSVWVLQLKGMCVLTFRRLGRWAWCVAIFLRQRVKLQNIHPMNFGRGHVYLIFFMSWPDVEPDSAQLSSVYLISDHHSVPPLFPRWILQSSRFYFFGVYWLCCLSYTEFFCIVSY